MITTMNFTVKRSQRYHKKGWWIFAEVVPVDGDGNRTIDTAEDEAKKEFDRQLNQTEKELGKLVQLLNYQVYNSGGCENEDTYTIPDHVVTICATGVFRKD